MSYAFQLRAIKHSDQIVRPVELQIISSRRNWMFEFNLKHQDIASKFMRFVHWAHLKLNRYYFLKNQPNIVNATFIDLIEPLLRVLDELIVSCISAPYNPFPDLWVFDYFFNIASFEIPPSGVTFTGVLVTLRSDLVSMVFLTDIPQIHRKITDIFDAIDEVRCMVCYFLYFLIPLSQYTQVRIDHSFEHLEVETFYQARTRINNRTILSITE